MLSCRLPIGGLKEKLLAALRAGITTVIIPKENEKDLAEVPDNVKTGLKIMPVSNVGEVLKIALVREPVAIDWAEPEAEVVPRVALDEGDPADGLTKILVLPSLPTAEPFRSQSVELLKAHGIDAIISFRSMLIDILDKIEINQNYSKSDTLQVMRILKNYDLLKDAQLDMFPERPAAPRRAKS